MRKSHPWFRASKNTWYVTLEGSKVSLGVHGEENEAEAIKAWHRLMSEGKPIKKPKSLTVKDLIIGFLSDSEERVKANSQFFYERFLKPFVKAFGKSMADTLTPLQVEKYSRKPTWSNSTRHNCLGTIVTAFRWAEKERLIEANPLKGLRFPPKESAGLEMVISESNYQRLLDATEGDFQKLLQFLWHTGCRPSEGMNLSVEQIDLASDSLVLRKHKTAHKGKARVIYLSDEARELLKAQSQRHRTGCAFQSLTGKSFSLNNVVNRLHRLSRKLKARFTAYGFRHSYATRALSNGIPDATVAALLGHSGTTMLHKHYSHLTSNSRLLLDAAKRV